jgi:tetratricopeptide (TPR) repeat protein
VRELGRGAFARVYLAKEETLGDRPVAVKISVRGGGEAQTLGRIRHPNIVSVHSVQGDAPSGLTAVCMPYLGSATLCDVLDRVSGLELPKRGSEIIEAITAGRLEETGAPPGAPDRLVAHRSYTDAVIHLGAQLADALACIHAMGICHRDLKPSNVLMSPEGRPMLLDFNLSFDERGGDNRLGGTLPYMSPEQLEAIDPQGDGAAHQVGTRSDIYSLGILLYELLTGVHPYGPLPLRLSTNELRRCLLQRQECRPRPIRELNSRVDAGLARLIEQCLRHDPKDRPQWAQDLAWALKRMLSPIGRMKRWASLNPAIAAASVLAITALGGFVAGAATHEGQAARYFREGQEAYARQDYTGAVEKLGRSLELQPDPQVLLARGQAYQRLNNLDDAVKDYERSNAIVPSAEAAAAAAQVLLARARACKNGADAMTDYERSNALVPSGEAASAAAYIHDLRLEYEHAVRLYRQVITMGSAGPVVYNNLGASLVQMNRPLDAMPYLDWAIQHSPDLQEAYYNRALADYQSYLSHGSKISDRVGISLPLIGTSGPLGVLAAIHVGEAENIPTDAMRDMDTAIRIGPAVAQLYQWKADMCAYAARRDTYYVEPMCQAIETAIRLGQPASSFRDEPRDLYNPFATSARFQKAKYAVPQEASLQPIKQFLEPSVDPVAKARTALPAG